MAGPATSRDIHRAVSLLRATHDAIVTTDLAGVVTSWNEGAERLYGYAEDEALGRSVLDFFVDAGVAVSVDDLAAGGHIAPFDIEVRAKTGGPVTVHASLFGLFDDDGVLFGIGSIAHDVTALRRVEREVRHSRLHDEVTGLPNRRCIERRLGDAVTTGPVGAVCVDLRRFRVVNDTWGHATGDLVLAELANRFTELLGADDVAGRLDADRFLLVSRDATPERLQRLVDAIVATLEPPVALPDREAVSIGAVVGVALAGRGTDPAELVRDAELAAYRAKGAGGAAVVWYRDELRAEATRRLQLERDLGAALDRGEITVAHQPIVDLSSGAVRSVETLARWTHPTLGPVSPEQFVTVAEESGLIGRLGDAVLELACRDLAAGPADLRCSVNLSTAQLHDDGLVERVSDIAARHGVDLRRITFEVVEATLGDSRRALVTLAGLRRLGCRISVDDFGTGWSSLARIKQLPIDEIKVDRTFVSGLPHDRADVAVVDAVVRVARSLDLAVVAEGVETDEQLDAVRALGCDAAQGYLLGRPAPAPAATTTT